MAGLSSVWTVEIEQVSNALHVVSIIHVSKTEALFVKWGMLFTVDLPKNLILLF